LLGWAYLLGAEALAGELTPSPEPTLAPAFTLEDLKGQRHRLEDYRGKVIVVNFWATWCPPCIAELPSMQRLAERMADEPFEILAVNVQESPFRVWNFMKVVDVRLTVLLDEKRKTFEAWGGRIFPTSYLLDEAGNIRYVAYGPLEWDSEEVLARLDELLHPDDGPD
jgi:thiol-disulfide isomerase/thioredoxin